MDVHFTNSDRRIEKTITIDPSRWFHLKVTVGHCSTLETPNHPMIIPRRGQDAAGRGRTPEFCPCENPHPRIYQMIQVDMVVWIQMWMFQKKILHPVNIRISGIFPHKPSSELGVPPWLGKPPTSSPRASVHQFCYAGIVED